VQRPLRLKKQIDFQRLRQTGKTWHHKALILSVVANELPHNRYGFIVSKHMGKAVVRNRLRRQMRACFSSAHERLLYGYDMVVIARRPILDLAYGELCGAITRLLTQANLWRPVI
jgi:ribonuclease P protein component